MHVQEEPELLGQQPFLAEEPTKSREPSNASLVPSVTSNRCIPEPAAATEEPSEDPPEDDPVHADPPLVIDGDEEEQSQYTMSQIETRRGGSRILHRDSDSGRAVYRKSTGSHFPKRPMFCRLSKEFWAKAESVFLQMDADNSNAVTRSEALEFFQGGYRGLSVDAMFNEIDTDNSGVITAQEFMEFWVQVRQAGYSEKEMIDELEEVMQGGTWVDWHDGRDVTKSTVAKFPRRPWLCRLPATTWSKSECLFQKLAAGDGTITLEKAEKFFSGGFGKVSAGAMFNEIDVHHHGNITPDMWIEFWKQVRSSGYKPSQINEELDNLIAGGAWVDFKDGRKT